MICDRRIWITGGGSGIGKALALQLDDLQNQVVISGRSEDKLQAVAQQGKNIQVLHCDVSDDNIQQSVREQLQQKLGGLDMVILSAGHCEYIDNAEPDTALFRRVYDSNVFGAVNTLAIALPLLRLVAGAQRPRLVCVASLSAELAFPRAEAYGSSKAALQYLFDSLRVDLAHENIGVTVVNPGFIKTPMTDKNDFSMPFLMPPEAAAERIIKGVASGRRNVNFPKRLYWLLRLMAALPGLWFKVLAPRLSRTS